MASPSFGNLPARSAGQNPRGAAGHPSGLVNRKDKILRRGKCCHKHHEKQSDPRGNQVWELPGCNSSLDTKCARLPHNPLHEAIHKATFFSGYKKDVNILEHCGKRGKQVCNNPKSLIYKYYFDFLEGYT